MTYVRAGLILGELYTTKQGQPIFRFLYEVTGVARKRDRVFGWVKDANGCFAFDMRLSSVERDIADHNFIPLNGAIDRKNVTWFNMIESLKSYLFYSFYKYSKRRPTQVDIELLPDDLVDSSFDSEK